MVTSGPQLSGTGDPSLHPSRRWYWVAGGLLAGGLICIALAVAGFFALDHQIADFQRAPVPGQADVTFAQPGGYVLYIEESGQCCAINVSSGSSSAPFPSWSMRISLRPVNGGPQVSISSWPGPPRATAPLGTRVRRPCISPLTTLAGTCSPPGTPPPARSPTSPSAGASAGASSSRSS